jgi:hypothetical protein
VKQPAGAREKVKTESGNNRESKDQHKKIKKGKGEFIHLCLFLFFCIGRASVQSDAVGITLGWSLS